MHHSEGWENNNPRNIDTLIFIFRKDCLTIQVEQSFLVKMLQQQNSKQCFVEKRKYQDRSMKKLSKKCMLFEK